MSLPHDAVGEYRSIIAGGDHPLYSWSPVFGFREGEFGLQVLVNSIGGRAWINAAEADVRRSGTQNPNVSVALSLYEEARRLGYVLGASIEGMENEPTWQQQCAACESLVAWGNKRRVSPSEIRSLWDGALREEFTDGYMLGKLEPAGASARAVVKRRLRREMRGETSS